MNFKELKIGNFSVKVPIIQGGMSIKNSMAPLAAAVSNAGGIGVIGASAIPIEELINELKKAKEMTQGVVAVNIMYAITDFVDVVKASINNGADIIFTGAGFSKDIYKIVKDTGKSIGAIVSSVKAARLAERLGADVIVVEGCEAGGHLGTDRSLDEIFPEIRESVKSIPVIAAGGIVDGFDIGKYMKMGADGVQMASRFVCSEECSAPESYKQMYLNARKEDIVVVESPVGLHGRAIKNRLVDNILQNKVTFNGCSEKCLKSCSLKYCINEKLKNAMNGDMEDGLVFSGANSWKINDILPVSKIFDDLMGQFKQFLSNYGLNK